MTKKILLWFRQDLRLTDNPALHAAAKAGMVLPVYIDDPDNAGAHALGAASRWWLHHSLIALDNSLKGSLAVYQGNPQAILSSLCLKHHIDAIYWCRCYTPWQIKRDQQIKTYLSEQEIEVKSFNGSLLWEPWHPLKADGTPYKVFTAFYRRGCLNAPPPRQPFTQPSSLSLIRLKNNAAIARLGLIDNATWSNKLQHSCQPGEQFAKQQLNDFIENKLQRYNHGRDFPAEQAVSNLSSYLRFGELSPHQVWHLIKNQLQTDNSDTFLKQLAWREFSYSLLYHFPQLPSANLYSKFDPFPWQKDNQQLKAWQQGQTGYPLVDAGMRQLWQTGTLHNRVRMIVASFLVKNCLIDWRLGAAWFWDCLTDADLANNSASWQWVAGCGADAAPYFRIFNPVSQAKKFDPNGDYIRHYVPELKALNTRYLFDPSQAPLEQLLQGGITLDENYPRAIVDLKATRARALAAYRQLAQEPS